jgi:nucleotide-binding universal stress UspA family protein
MKILIATDGLPAAAHAIHQATRVLAAKGADILVISVLDSELHTGGNQDAEDDVARGIAALKEHGIQARGEVLRGRYVETIVAKATEFGADVLVVGHERSSRLVQLVVGSVASEVVRRFTGAVLVVPHSPEPRHG